MTKLNSIRAVQAVADLTTVLQREFAVASGLRLASWSDPNNCYCLERAFASADPNEGH